MNNGQLKRFAVTLISTLLYSQTASAHVKWFIDVDISESPTNFFDIMQTPAFAFLLSLSLVVLFAGNLIDGWWWKRYGRINLLHKVYQDQKDPALTIVRMTVGVVFFALWLMGDVLLAPDLPSNADFVSTLLFIIAVSVLTEYTIAASAIGIFMLFGYAVYTYGIFHMIDYLTMPGLAAFLLISWFKSESAMRYRLPLLYLLTGFSFIWSAVEKLAYPQWYSIFIDRYSFLTMGLDSHFFIMATAFIELSLFFMIISGKNAAIIAALIANIVINAGNIYFGKLDTLGHLPVVFVLALIAISGGEQTFLSPQKRINNLFVYSITQVGVFTAVMATSIAAYYGLHATLYS